MNYSWNSDDLGSHYYEFYDCSLAKAVNKVLEVKNPKYKIVHIRMSRQFWLFGTRIVNIVLEDPQKIEKLKGSQHYSKSYEESGD